VEALGLMEHAAEKLSSVVGLLYALKTQPAHQEYKPLIPCFFTSLSSASYSMLTLAITNMSIHRKSTVYIMRLMALPKSINNAMVFCASKALAQTINTHSITMSQTTYAWQRPSTIRNSYRNHYLVCTWCII